MIKTFFLVTEACTLNFNILNIFTQENIIDVNVDVEVNTKFKGYLPSDFNCRFYVADLKRLIVYFQTHIDELISNNYNHSKVYTPLEADFSIRALDGDIETENDGCFSVLIMINCGKINDESFNSYFGLTSVIDINNVSVFCNDINKILSEM